MLSEDFILAGQTRRDYDDWYQEEIVNNEMYKTLYFRYKNMFYQFEPIGYKKDSIINGKKVKKTSYIFMSFKSEDEYPESYKNPVCFDSFKDAIDNAKMDDGKTFKEIWDNPDSEYLAFQ